MAHLLVHRPAPDAARHRSAVGPDFFWATVLTTSPETQPITAGLSSLNGQWVAAWHLVSAGSILAALPPVAMFFLMQKHFIAGLTLGAVK
jgi:multiple sugar transport system permease protein